METTRRIEKVPLKDMDKMVAPLLHRKLTLKVEGMGVIKEGDWRSLMRLAQRFGMKNWEIVEKVSTLGERIITRHSSLLQGNQITGNETDE